MAGRLSPCVGDVASPATRQPRNDGCEPSMESIQVTVCSDEEEFELSPHSAQPLLFLSPFRVYMCVHFK